MISQHFILTLVLQHCRASSHSLHIFTYHKGAEVRGMVGSYHHCYVWKAKPVINYKQLFVVIILRNSLVKFIICVKPRIRSFQTLFSTIKNLYSITILKYLGDIEKKCP